MMSLKLKKRIGFALLCAFVFVAGTAFAAKKPHAVFVVGTTHYSPQLTMPPLAKELERHGFETTVISSDYNPEKNPKGLSGLNALRKADVAIFYTRFLTLPAKQMKHIERYLESGKPVVGFRTSTHGFMYPKDHALAKWNNGFGKDALGSQYFIHTSSPTDVAVAKGAAGHEILTGVDLSKPRRAAGTLYLSELPKDATVLLRGTSNSKKTGTIKNGFGTVEMTPVMTDDVAWTWKNQWGGRVFTTTVGHPGSFADENWVRFFVNGIHWAAEKPVPSADVKIGGIKVTIPPKGKKAKPVTTAKKSEGKPAPTQVAAAQAPKKQRKKTRAVDRPGAKDAKNIKTGKPAPETNAELEKYGMYENKAPRAERTKPVTTTLPLKLKKGARIALIGNTLMDRDRDFGYLETLLHQRFPEHNLVVRNLSWSADTPDLQPRPANLADTIQHLTHEKADVIFAAYGFNESFDGKAGLEKFRKALTEHVADLRSRAFNGKTGPQVVLLSPIANENIKGVPAADLNNVNIELYAKVIKEVAAVQKVAYLDVFQTTRDVLSNPATDLTINGIHLGREGYHVLASTAYRGLFAEDAPTPDETIRAAVVEKDTQYFYRYRPLNTFYYTGDRNKTYGYVDFLPAMRNFDIMVENRTKRIWDLAKGKQVPEKIDDSNIPKMPEVWESRGANEWMTAADELKAFKIDPRFEVNLFAGEEQFPDVACPIQMRWDAKGRLWVSCSTTYPHVYPGSKPNDKIIILEDTDGDGRADKSTVFADDLYVPLSFEFGDGGVYVSEEPHLTFIKDTDGDGKADYRKKVLTGFGCEDSHHALHDFSWTPDGDLIFRESIFHHSQVETPYGPRRQQNSGWFRFQPRDQRLTSFGCYHSTNPWGVTFDDWGQHVASHPIYAAAFHALDPVYPEQHPKPAGLKAYSGTCGHEFIDFPFWPEEMQGGFMKARYKPTNRIEYHKWKRTEFGYDEEYVSDIIFSANLSFIPVDMRFGPRGAMYVCDWYNPIKGHAQYSLRDPRRDKHSGRIWRIVPKGAKLQDPPKIDGVSTPELVEILKRPEYRYRYWAKRELRARDADEVKAAIDAFVKKLDPSDVRHRHHQIEAVWAYRNVDRTNPALLKELLDCEHVQARAAATQQLRYWHGEFDDAAGLIRKRANDPNPIVRMEAAIAASWIGSKPALVAMLDTLKHPTGEHLAYGIRTALGSHSLKQHWDGDEAFNREHPQLAEFYANFAKAQKLKPKKIISAQDANFDSQKNLKSVKIECVRERMLYTVNRIEVKAGQPVRIEFVNPDATPHNFVIVEPGALFEIAMASNEMAKDPTALKKGFIPDSKKILHHTKMLQPESAETLRFKAPTKPGVYPYLCTFPGHWVLMKGELVVK
jgi:azurin